MSASMPSSTPSNMFLQAVSVMLIDFSNKAKIILSSPVICFSKSHSESENIMFQEGGNLAAMLVVFRYNYPVSVELSYIAAHHWKAHFMYGSIIVGVIVLIPIKS